MNTAQLVYDISSSYDAFGRLRVSEPYTLFDSKLLYDTQPFLWDELQTSGSNTSSSYNSNEAAVIMSVSSNIAGVRVRQTYQRFAYQPGKSQFIMMTGILGSYSNDIIRRIGPFSSNDGLFFQSGPDDNYIVKRSSVTGTPVDLAIPQSQWNKNKLDQIAPIQINFDKANIFYFNYEWLGVGDICCGIVIGKKFIQLHQFHYANENTNISFSKPNLPLRYEIRNLGRGPSASMKCICSSVMSEGGQQSIGYQFSIDRDGISLTTSASRVIYPLLAIKLKKERPGVNVFIESLNIISPSTNAIFRWSLLLNSTISGDELVYTDSPTGNFEYCGTNTNGTNISGGFLLRSGYGVGNSANLFNDSVAARISLGISINNTPDVIYLCVERLDNQNNTFYAAMTVRVVV